MRRIALMFAVAALVAVAVVGCNEWAKPAKVDRPNMSNVEVEVLFTDADGYTVKRFTDGGIARYYVTPGPSRVVHQVPQGKSSRPEEITTAGPK